MQGGPRSGSSRGLTAFGLILGLAGALLDFYMGYSLVSQSGMPAYTMGASSQAYGPGLVWGVGLIGLGVVLIVTAAATVFPGVALRMSDFGALMIVYGVVMLFVGAVMLLGVTPMMQGSLSSGAEMLVVGTLMLANGGLMRRPSMR
jgi:hypothetical protein